MTYRFDKKNPRGGKILKVIFVIIFFVVVFFWPFFRKFAYTIMEPVWVRSFEIVNSTGVIPGFLRTYLSSRESLSKRQLELEQNIERLENLTQEQALTIRGLQVLVGDGVSGSSVSNTPVVMYSLATDITHLYSLIIFSKGFGDNVEVGDRVYLRGRQAICTIGEVFARTSTCIPYSSYLHSVDGVTSSSSINVTLSGRGGHYLATVTRDTPILVGEKVLLREDQSYVLGVVTQVFNNDQETSWQVLVDAPYNPVSSSLFYLEKKSK